MKMKNTTNTLGNLTRHLIATPLFQLTCSFGSEDLGFVLENIRELSAFVDFNSKFDSGPIDTR